jgi:hypothetical protein
VDYKKIIKNNFIFINIKTEKVFKNEKTI